MTVVLRPNFSPSPTSISGTVHSTERSIVQTQRHAAGQFRPFDPKEGR